MGQDDVYNFLVKHEGQWFTNNQLSKKLKISIGSITRSTSKLCDKGIILHKPIPGSNNGRFFMVEIDVNPVSGKVISIIIFLLVLSIAFGAYNFGMQKNI